MSHRASERRLSALLFQAAEMLSVMKQGLEAGWRQGGHVPNAAMHMGSAVGAFSLVTMGDDEEAPEAVRA